MISENLLIPLQEGLEKIKIKNQAQSNIILKRY